MSQWKEQLEEWNVGDDVAIDATPKQVEAFIQSKFAELINQIPNDCVVPCSCPKGGKYERENGSYYDCDKCGGTEYLSVKDQLKKEWLQ